MAGRVSGTLRSNAGGIVALADLIDAHRGAFEYDWRTRFGKPLAIVGRSMTWGEAYRLTQQITMDPSSHVAAAVAGWDHAIPREVLVLMDLFDLQHASKSKRKPKPYPRPWSKDRRKLGGARLTREQLRAILDKHRGESA